MAEQLTTEQILLLNNLMYAPNNSLFKGMGETDADTVAEFIDNIDVTQIVDDKDYGSFITGEDWKELIAAVKNDEQLMNLQIAETHVDCVADGGGGGVSAVFVDPSTNEAIVTFRGTASLEWKDNFIGGGPTDAQDGVSTAYQENALDWYQSLDLDKYSSITVTGHSKGGNKAKYITVLDDSVDRCVAFDGQGFSDEFINKYQDQIALNEDKIANNNVEGDYVNILLNDIGNTTYYEGYDIGNGGFLENHCPNTFMKFNSDGSFEMVEGTQDPRMAEVDLFLNNYLRTLSAEDKQAALEMIGGMVEGGFNGADVNEILGILLEGDNVDLAANLAAYLLEYKKENPELVDSLNDILTDMGLDNIVEIVNTIVDVTEWEYFDTLADVAGWLSGHIPDFIYDYLQDWLAEKGIKLSKAQLEKLIGMLQTLANDMDNVSVVNNGQDLSVISQSDSSDCAGSSNFSILIEKNRKVEAELEACVKKMIAYVARLEAVYGKLGPEYTTIRIALKAILTQVRKEVNECQKMEETLKAIHNCYENTEKRVHLSARSRGKKG